MFVLDRSGKLWQELNTKSDNVMTQKQAEGGPITTIGSTSQCPHRTSLTPYAGPELKFKSPLDALPTHVLSKLPLGQAS